MFFRFVIGWIAFTLWAATPEEAGRYLAKAHNAYLAERAK